VRTNANLKTTQCAKAYNFTIAKSIFNKNEKANAELFRKSLPAVTTKEKIEDLFNTPNKTQ
jgi:hypothetical protein